MEILQVNGNQILNCTVLTKNYRNPTTDSFLIVKYSLLAGKKEKKKHWHCLYQLKYLGHYLTNIISSPSLIQDWRVAPVTFYGRVNLLHVLASLYTIILTMEVHNCFVLVVSTDLHQFQLSHCIALQSKRYKLKYRPTARNFKGSSCFGAKVAQQRTR